MKTCKRIACLILSLVFMLAAAAVGSVTACAIDGDAAGKPSVKVTNCGLDVTAGYKETGYFSFEKENVPDGATVHVFVNDEDQGEREYIYVNEPTEDYTVEARILDADGETIATSGVIRVTVKNGFFDRIAAFFKRTFGTAADAVADVVSAFFMTIVVFLNGGKLF